MLKSLFVWLEGTSDEDFFREIVKPILRERYQSISTIPYAQQPDNETNRRVREVARSHEELDYLWFADLDPEQFPCVTARKNATTSRYPHLRIDRIAVVEPEIEAWYLAGLDGAACEALRIREYQNTNSLTKEDYKKLISSTRRSEIDFRMDILGEFSMEVAKRKNDSFAYFCRKYIEVI